ncbi:MAG: outer membrane protein assembly factor BamD [Candidatus Omnitrophica bacterium]|nr:outer membrane protein assembly factor BamD [Candidatus Omnitrophota bacterium]
MKKNIPFHIILSITFFFIFSISACRVCSAFWIWTPKSNTAVNPKFAAKDTPDEQFEWAMRFFKNKEFQRSADEFIRLTRHYRDSDLAPEAQYYAGRSFEELGKYYFAYENYQKTVDSYPYTRRLEEIIEREYNIANILQTKETPKLMDLELNVSLDRAVTIYKKIIENSTFGKYADKSLYRMAECYRRMRNYNKAVDAYDRLVTDHPNSELVSEARYQLAYTMYEASLDPDYDQEGTEEALKKFERISKTTPVPAIAEEAEKAIGVLRGRKAQSLLKVAAFYEKQGRYGSALVYYRDVLARFPETDAAGEAEERAGKLEKRSRK